MARPGRGSRLDVRSIRRDQILDAAEPLVARRGWAQTTFADIGREANISNGVLTSHFADKDDLLLALFERVARRWRERFAFELTSQAPIGEKIRAAAAEAVRRADQERELTLLLLHYLSQATSHPEIAARLGRLFAETRALFAAEIEQSIERGEIGKIDVDSVAGLRQCLFLDIGLGRAALGIETPSERLANDAATLLLAFLLGSSGRHPGGSGSATPEPAP